MPPIKKAPPKKLVCFKTDDGKTTTAFHAAETRNKPSCRGRDDAFFVKTQYDPLQLRAITERDILKKVNSTRIPKVYEVNSNGTIVMDNVGPSLDKMVFARQKAGVRSFIRHHKTTFISDLTTAFRDLMSVGYLHKDMSHRNITYKDGHFYLIDFGTTEPISNYVNRHGLIPDPAVMARSWYKKLSYIPKPHKKKATSQ